MCTCEFYLEVDFFFFCGYRTVQTELLKAQCDSNKQNVETDKAFVRRALERRTADYEVRTSGVSDWPIGLDKLCSIFYL